MNDDGSGGGGGTGGGPGDGDGTTDGGAGGEVSSGTGGSESSIDPNVCWPFEALPADQLRMSEKKVFAHYFSPYPISIDNKPAAEDYYTNNYLSPHGEDDKFLSGGGLLRDRPLPREPQVADSYHLENLKIEVARAITLGLDGFTYNMLGTSGTHYNRLLLLLQATQAVDADFKILLMPDMYSEFKDDPNDAATDFVDTMTTLVEGYGDVLFKSENDRLVISPYGAEKRTADWWKSTLDALTAAGVENDFVPLFSNVPWSAATEELQASVPLYGTSSWGTRTPSGASGLLVAPEQAHDLGLLWMSPVSPQDMRPKNLTAWEAEGSAAIRAQWEATIQGGADWVQLITWNDYSEHSHVSPSAQTGYGFYDLSGYYLTWFKMGSPPPIVRDRLYYFHRSHDMSALPDASLQTGGVFTARGEGEFKNEVELVAFLTAPSSLEIEIAGKVTAIEVGAGLQTLRAPLLEGTPVFRIIRNGKKLEELTSVHPISNEIKVQDPLYKAGSLSGCTRERFFER